MNDNTNSFGNLNYLSGLNNNLNNLPRIGGNCDQVNLDVFCSADGRKFFELCNIIKNLLIQYGMCEDEVDQHIEIFVNQFKKNHPKYSLEKTKEQIEQDEVEDFCKLALGDEYGKPKLVKKEKGLIGNIIDDFMFWKE